MMGYDIFLLISCSFMLVSSKYIEHVPDACARIKEGIYL